MNSVHEPGSRTTSKNRLRNNTESKRIENRPSAPSAQPKASLRAQAARPTPCPAPCLSVAATVTVLWLGWALYCNTVQPCLALFYCNITQPVAIQFLPLLGSFSAIQKLYCNTIFFPFSPPCNTIPQYKMGSSPFQIFFFYARNFLFSILIKNFFFTYFQQLEKITKNHKIIFFFIFHNTSNKFIKIYFSPIPSIFQSVKILENYFLLFSTK